MMFPLVSEWQRAREKKRKKNPTRVFSERPDKILWRLRLCLLIVSIVCHIFSAALPKATENVLFFFFFKTAVK